MNSKDRKRRKIRIDPLDTLFSEFVRKRAMARMGGCERCLTPKFDIQKDNGDVMPAWKQLQCSHFVGRSKHSVRYDEDNAVGLCPACHMYFTAHPLEHIRWFEAQLGEEKFDWLNARSVMPLKPDRDLIAIYLRQKIAELDGTKPVKPKKNIPHKKMR